MFIYWNDDFTASEHASDTTRKSRAIIESLVRDPIENLTVIDPMSDFVSDGRVWSSCFDEAALEHISRIHVPEYVEAVRTGTPGHLARSQGFRWDPGIFTMAVAHTTGLMAAVHRALEHGTRSGSLSSGLHHARPDTGCGYCTFNGLAAAVSFAITGWNARRILVLDLDAHGGGGTDEIIARNFPDRVVHVDVTTSAFDGYREREGNLLRRANPETYMAHVERALDYAVHNGPYDLVIHNAGMDPINTGVPVGDIVERERWVHNMVGDTPAVFALAGGYTWDPITMDDLVGWHRITLETWARHGAEVA